MHWLRERVFRCIVKETSGLQEMTIATRQRSDKTLWYVCARQIFLDTQPDYIESRFAEFLDGRAGTQPATEEQFHATFEKNMELRGGREVLPAAA